MASCQRAVYVAVGSMRPMRLWAVAAGSLTAYSVYGISMRSGYKTSRSAVRSSSVGCPIIGWKDAAAVAKRVVISSGVIVGNIPLSHCMSASVVVVGVARVSAPAVIVNVALMSSLARCSEAAVGAASRSVD